MLTLKRNIHAKSYTQGGYRHHCSIRIMIKLSPSRSHEERARVRNTHTHREYQPTLGRAWEQVRHPGDGQLREEHMI
jgi:hypothetical protein